LRRHLMPLYRVRGPQCSGYTSRLRSLPVPRYAAPVPVYEFHCACGVLTCRQATPCGRCLAAAIATRRAQARGIGETWVERI